MTGDRKNKSALELILSDEVQSLLDDFADLQQAYMEAKGLVAWE